MNLELVPAIRFEPSELGIENFGELLALGEWDSRWSAALQALSVRPIKPGSWLVPTHELRSDAAFDAVLRAHLTDSAEPCATTIPPADEIGSISGGYVFIAGGVIQLEPGCCCDLADLDHWAAAFRGESAEVSLMIGHGNFSLAKDGSDTIVTFTPEQPDCPAVVLHFDAPDVEHAIQHAELEQRRFAESLKSYLSRVAPSERVDELAKLLVFGH